METSTNLLKEHLAGEEFDRGELVNVELYWEAPDIGEEPKTSIIAVFKQLHFKGVKNMIQGYSMRDGHFYMDYNYYQNLKRSGEYPLHKDKQILSTLEDTYGYKLNIENKPL